MYAYETDNKRNRHRQNFEMGEREEIEKPRLLTHATG